MAWPVVGGLNLPNVKTAIFIANPPLYI
jgi:hypothetical protein